MDMVLKRKLYCKDGVFGELQFHGTEAVYCLTLEHAFLQPDGTYKPGVAVGEYKCIRGTHRLEHMDHDFLAFELQKVPDRTQVLIHPGNYNQDSKSCILIGKEPPLSEKNKMISNSQDTFKNFMQLQSAVSEFILTILA